MKLTSGKPVLEASPFEIETEIAFLKEVAHHGYVRLRSPFYKIGDVLTTQELREIRGRVGDQRETEA